MKFSFLVLLNAILMAGLGFMEFKLGDESRIIPLLFVFLGIITLSMNNTVVAGSTSVAKVVLVFILASIACLIEPIHYAYIRYHMPSVWRYSGILMINILTAFALIKFIYFDARVKK